MDGWNEDDVLKPEGSHAGFEGESTNAFNPFRPVSAADRFQRQTQQAPQDHNELIQSDPGQMYGQPWTAPLSPPQPLAQPRQPIYDGPGVPEPGMMQSGFTGGYTGSFQQSGGYPRIDDDPMPYPAGGFAIGGQPLPGPGGYQSFPPMFTAPVQPTGYEQPYPQQPYPRQPFPHQPEPVQGVSSWSGPMQPVQGNPMGGYPMQDGDLRYTGGYPAQQLLQPGYGVPYSEPQQGDSAPEVTADPQPSPWELPQYPEEDSDWQPDSEALKAAELYRAQQQRQEEESRSKSSPDDLNIPSYLKASAKLRKPPALTPLKNAEAAGDEASPSQEKPTAGSVQPEPQEEWFTNATYQRPQPEQPAEEPSQQADPAAGEEAADQRVVLPPARRSRRSRQAEGEADAPVIQSPVIPARPEPPEDNPPGGEPQRRRRSRHGNGETTSAQGSAADGSGDASSSDAGDCLPFVNQAGAKDTGVNPASVRPVPACNNPAAPERPSSLRRPMLIRRSAAAYRADPEDADDQRGFDVEMSGRQDGNTDGAAATGGISLPLNTNDSDGGTGQPFAGQTDAPATATPVQPVSPAITAFTGFAPLVDDGDSDGSSWQPFAGQTDAPATATPVQPVSPATTAFTGFAPLVDDGDDDGWQPFSGAVSQNAGGESAGFAGETVTGASVFDNPVIPGAPLFSGFSLPADDWDDHFGSWQSFGDQPDPDSNPLFPHLADAASGELFTIPDLPEHPGTLDMPLNDEALNELFGGGTDGAAERPFGISSYDAGDMPNPDRGNLPYDVVSAFDTGSSRRSIELIDATGGLKPESAPEPAPAPETETPAQASPALPRKDHGKPPIKVSRLILLVVAAAMLLFCIAAGGRILIAYVQNTDEMANLSGKFYDATGLQLNEAGETVQLNQDGTTFPPDGNNRPSILDSLTGQSDSGQNSHTAQTAATGSKRTRLSEYPLEQRFTIISTIDDMQKGDPEEDRPPYPNVVGQLTIPGFLQEWVVDGKDSTYYINHNYRNTSDYYGAVYVEQSCTLETPPENLHLRGSDAISDTGSEAVFSKLWQYKTGGSTFTMAHNTAHLITLHEELDFELFAVIEASGDPSRPDYFNYFSQPSFQSDDAMMNYVAAARRLSIYTLPADVQPGHRLLTVSTASVTGDTSLVLLFRSNRLYSDEYVEN